MLHAFTGPNTENYKNPKSCVHTIKEEIRIEQKRFLFLFYFYPCTDLKPQAMTIAREKIK